MSRFLRRATLLCISSPFGTICGVLLLTAAAVFVLVTQMRVETDTDAMINPDLEFRAQYSAYQKLFPQLSDTLVILVDSAAPEVRQRATDLIVTRLAQEDAYVRTVFSAPTLPFFKNNGLLFLDYAELADRMDQLIAGQPFLGPMLRAPTLDTFLSSLAEAQENEPGNPQLADIRAQLGTALAAARTGGDPVFSFQSAFLGGDGDDLSLIIVQPKLAPAKLQPAKAALAAIKTAAQAAAAQAGGLVAVSYTGKIALNTEELQSVSKGAARAGVLSFILVAIVLIAGLRSIRVVMATLAVLMMGLAITGAAGLLIFGALNIISVAFAVLFIGLGIDFAIHHLLRAREALTQSNMAEALGEASATTGSAMVICAPTTAVAFLSFGFTDYAGLAQLGVISAIGVVVAVLLALSVLPAIISIIWRGQGAAPAPASSSWLNRPRARVALIFAVAALIPASFFAMSVRFSADPVALKDDQSPSVQAYQRLIGPGGQSPYAVQLLADSRQAAGQMVQNAEQVDVAGRILWAGSFLPAEQADKLDLIGETYDLLAPDFIASQSAFSDVAGTLPAQASAHLKRISAFADDGQFTGQVDAFVEAAQGQPEHWAVLSHAVLSSWQHLAEMLERQLQTGGVAADDVPDELRSRYLSETGTWRVEVFPANPITSDAQLAAFTDAMVDVFPEATGSPVQIVNAGRVVQTSMVQATLTALVAVSLILLIVLRSALQVALVLMPVFLAALFTLGAAGALGIDFNFANVIVLPLLLGLGVDAGIHYVRRAFEGQMPGDTGSTDKAVLLSALTTVASFGTLMVSGHDGTASMGQLLSLALGCLLFTTLVVLPSVLIFLRQTR